MNTGSHSLSCVQTISQARTVSHPEDKANKTYYNASVVNSTLLRILQCQYFETVTLSTICIHVTFCKLKMFCLTVFLLLAMFKCASNSDNLSPPTMTVSRRQTVNIFLICIFWVRDVFMTRMMGLSALLMLLSFIIRGWHLTQFLDPPESQ